MSNFAEDSHLNFWQNLKKDTKAEVLKKLESELSTTTKDRNHFSQIMVFLHNANLVGNKVFLSALELFVRTREISSGRVRMAPFKNTPPKLTSEWEKLYSDYIIDLLDISISPSESVPNYKGMCGKRSSEVNT